MFSQLTSNTEDITVKAVTATTDAARYINIKVNF